MELTDALINNCTPADIDIDLAVTVVHRVFQHELFYAYNDSDIKG